MRQLILSFFLLLGVMLSPASVLAQTDNDLFHTKLHTTVTVPESGLSTISHTFTITNQTPTTYINQYGLKLSSSELKNIRVVSHGQSLPAEIVSIPPKQQGGPGQTTIGITFADQVIGEGKTREFTISYTNPDAAVISGSVLEITLPPQANPEDYDEYVVTLVTPARFDAAVRTTPAISSSGQSGNSITTIFNQGGAQGVFAVFGKTQLFDLDIRYELENVTSNPGIAQVALPPDTIYQKMFYHQLEPLPDEMNVDRDGNWIATYQLKAGSKQTVQLNAVAQLKLEPDLSVSFTLPDEPDLQSQPFWPVNDGRIKQLAGTYSTPEAINAYIVKTLSYNTERALVNPERLGGSAVLDAPDQAVCQEFTDAFVTIARAAGVPARRVTGYAYTQNSDLRPLSLIEDVLHAWPEYFDADRGYWVPIDPTWEDTTGGVDYFHQVDLNHLVFAINSQSSTTPFPAGSYKLTDSTAKTVEVNFGSAFPSISPDTKFRLESRTFLGVPLPGLYMLVIKNDTGQAWYNLPLNIVSANTTELNLPAMGTIAAILPFQELAIPIQVRSKVGIIPRSDQLTIEINHDQTNFTILTGPNIIGYAQQPILLISLAGGLIIITLITGSVLVLRRPKRRSVRRKS